MKSLPAAVGLVALAPAIAACTNASENLTEKTGNQIPKVDLSGIEEQPEIAKLVPKDIRDRGTLINGAATDYAPGEFLDNGTAVGFDIDILAAIGKVLGLKTETKSAVFAQIIPAVGSKYDVGISSFTVSPERLESVNMVTYFEAGVAYAVQKGNPKKIDPKNLCGTSPAVQTGSYMEEVATAAKTQCATDGNDEVTILSYANNADAVTNVAGGKADVLMADSPVINYAISTSDGALEIVGEVEEKALNGIVVSKDAPELTDAIHKAVQYLIDSGELSRILKAWGNDSGAISTSEVNPA